MVRAHSSPWNLNPFRKFEIGALFWRIKIKPIFSKPSTNQKPLHLPILIKLSFLRRSSTFCLQKNLHTTLYMNLVSYFPLVLFLSSQSVKSVTLTIRLKWLGIHKIFVSLSFEFKIQFWDLYIDQSVSYRRGEIFVVPADEWRLNSELRPECLHNLAWKKSNLCQYGYKRQASNIKTSNFMGLS